MSAKVCRKTEWLSRCIDDYPEGIILPVDKPYRWTSADVIRKVKWAACHHFGKKNLKVGHAGTLDPLATGVLLVCIGKATKLADELQRERKQYLAGVSFGATTASFDREKEIDRRYTLEGVTREAVAAVLPGMTGEQMQVAPLFSAKSVDGVRAYETARRLYRESGTLPQESEGILSANRITIYDAQLVGWSERVDWKSVDPPSDPRSARINVIDLDSEGLPHADVLIDCSKGTYIRAFARDLGEALGTGAFLDNLRRTCTGEFRVEDCLSVDEAMAALAEAKLSI